MADLVAARRSKLAALRERGIDPFRQTRYDVTAHAGELALKYEGLGDQGRAEGETWSLAGRLMSVRRQGGVVFADLHDRTGRFQLFIRKNDVGVEEFELFKDIERGDIVGASGFVFRTKMGELSIHVRNFRLLSKSLQPLPDKWHGLRDIGKRYRQRYLDLIVNPNVLEVMVKRSRIIAEMRRYIDSHGFYEVETPTLVNIAGGASARPFITHSNALNLELSLRIATELYLKRLIVGGMERVYEIGRIWRNEGIDTTHNPEFTMLELYAAYWDVENMMRFNEDLMAHLARSVHGTETVRFAGDAISFSPPFRRLGYLDAFDQFAGITRTELLNSGSCAQLLRRYGMPDSPTHAHALDKLFERIVEPNLLQPTFVYGYPVVLSPLAKRMANDSELTERYELFVAHMELANAFTELNDPDEQARRFELQILEKNAGDDDVAPADWDFVKALEYGMPPTAGIGIGIDRLVMMLTDNTAIRDVLLFPLQRPTQEVRERNRSAFMRVATFVAKTPTLNVLLSHDQADPHSRSIQLDPDYFDIVVDDNEVVQLWPTKFWKAAPQNDVGKAEAYRRYVKILKAFPGQPSGSLRDELE